jgi:PIN domain nuclease of toxin-antitoxin system
MTSVLIDTQALIWFIQDDPKLSTRALALVDERSTRRLFSVASVWEMAIKIAIGKLPLRQGSMEDFLRVIHENEVELLPVLAPEAADVAKLPMGRHQDPFDRLIAAQCLRYNLPLISVDEQFDPYGVRRIW